MITMKCLKITYALFEAGKEYEFTELDPVGRFRVFSYTSPDGSVYKFGLDENGENENESVGTFMKFEL